MATMEALSPDLASWMILEGYDAGASFRSTHLVERIGRFLSA